MTGSQPETLLVTDTTAIAGGPIREHGHLIDGQPKMYRFSHAKALAMPFDEAMRFLPTPEFIVTNEDGVRYEPTPEQPEGAAALELETNQVVANLDELRKDALFTRCKTQVGSEHLTIKSTVPELVGFLISEAELARMNEPANLPDDQMTPEEIAALIPESDPGGAESQALV